MNPAISEILRANQSFYDAFSSANLVKMRAVWADTTEVVCIHPGWSPLTSIDEVMSSWDTIFRAQESFEISPVGEEVRIAGSMAFVICGESVNGEQATLVATNVFYKSEHGWKLLHHHASPVLGEDAYDALTSDENDTNAAEPGDPILH